jgi:hypothetical protein
VTTIIAMIVLGLATAINPPGVTLVVVLLMSPGGMRKALAYLAGSTMSIAIVSAAVAVLGTAALQATQSAGGLRHPQLFALFEVAMGLAMLGVGLWMLTTGKGGTNDMVNDALEDVKSVRAWMTFLIGAVLVSWTMPPLAVAELLSAEFPALSELALYGIYLVLALGTILVPIVLRAVWPERSKSFLEQARVWLAAHGGVLLAAVFIVLGLGFGIKGAAGFFG